jgi:hypothetical protein
VTAPMWAWIALMAAVLAGPTLVWWRLRKRLDQIAVDIADVHVHLDEQAEQQGGRHGIGSDTELIPTVPGPSYEDYRQMSVGSAYADRDAAGGGS